MEVCRGMKERRQNTHGYINSKVDYISKDLMRIKDHKSSSKNKSFFSFYLKRNFFLLFESNFQKPIMKREIIIVTKTQHTMYRRAEIIRINAVLKTKQKDNEATS